MMKKIFVATLMALAVMLQPVSLHARDKGLDLELGEAMQFVTKVDTKKKVIYMSRSQLGYNSLTTFYNKAGEKVDVGSVVKGKAIKYQVDHSKPYLHRPVATKVWVR